MYRFSFMNYQVLHTEFQAFNKGKYTIPRGLKYE